MFEKLKVPHNVVMPICSQSALITAVILFSVHAENSNFFLINEVTYLFISNLAKC